jgi:hypothetical protein
LLVGCRLAQVRLCRSRLLYIIPTGFAENAQGIVVYALKKTIPDSDFFAMQKHQPFKQRRQAVKLVLLFIVR